MFSSLLSLVVTESVELQTYPALVVDKMLKALKLHSNEARLKFPRLLQIIELYPEETLSLMTKEVSVCILMTRTLQNLDMFLFISKHISMGNAYVTGFPNQHCILLYSENIYNLKLYKRVFTFTHFPLWVLIRKNTVSEQGPQEEEEVCLGQRWEFSIAQFAGQNY